MKKILISVIVIVSAIMSLKAQEADTMFPYPNIPDNLTTLEDRSNYLISHFWDRCNMKSAFSAKDKLRQAFIDYINVAPYAHLDTVNASVDDLIEKVKKADQKNLLPLAQMAQDALFGDSAQFWSDDLYLPFAKAVVDSKKIHKSHKARFQYHVQILTHSKQGSIAYPLEFTDINGQEQSLKDISAPCIVLFFNEVDCDDCMIARARLSVDMNAKQAIQNGKLKIVSINPCEADDEWKENASSYSNQWIKGATPEVDNYFDMRKTPCIYILDKDRTILAKNIDIDTLLNIISRL